MMLRVEFLGGYVMAAFEFGNRAHLGHDDYDEQAWGRGKIDAPNAEVEAVAAHADKNKPPVPQIKDECIIAYKIYDQFRSQDCLTEDDIGPARAAEDKTIGEIEYHEGEVIEPPAKSASVTIERLTVKKIIVVSKEPNSFKRGYWDIDLKFVFEYRLVFREVDGCPIGSIKAKSSVNKRVSMFGSISSDIVIATDLFSHRGETTLMEAAPFINVEAKGVALSAELKYHRRRGGHGEHGENCVSVPCRVEVTIGLFCIVKLFRMVNLNVQSKGFCVPPEKEDPTPVNACDFFENLDFPMDIFAPPQKKEFKEGVSLNIPRSAEIVPCDC